MSTMSKKFHLIDVFGIPIYVDLTFLGIVLLCMILMGIYGIIFSILLAFSIVAHEYGHALTARMFGFRTNDITLSILGGCASLLGMPKDTAEEMSVAVMGPVVSFLLFGIGAVCYSIIGTDVLAAFAATNLVLGIFNLMPGFPMDGGRVLRAILCSKMSRVKATEWAMKVGRGFACLLALYGLVMTCIGNFGGITAILVAVMIWKVGKMEYDMVVKYGC